MFWLGRFLPGLSLSNLSSFHFVMVPIKTSASTGPVIRNSPGLNPSKLMIGTVPPIIAGNCT